jgi:hypothetical protein
VTIASPITCPHHHCIPRLPPGGAGEHQGGFEKANFERIVFENQEVRIGWRLMTFSVYLLKKVENRFTCIITVLLLI